MASSYLLLNSFHPELASLAEQAEQVLWTNPRAMLIQGRLFAERLAKIIAQESKVEPVYEIKQIDRLHLLERKGVIDGDIRSSFEWLRMNGNSAAHGAKEIPLDVALTAHRQIYELSAWFAETYGPLSIHVPDYVMPIPESAKAGDDLSSESISIALQQMIEDQVSGKLLSSIDKRFKAIQDTIDKLASSVGEWSQRSETNDGADKQTVSPQEVEKETAASAELAEAVQGVEIADYLSGKSMQILDKRSNGGALWVIGGWELKDILFGLKPQGFYFRFARNGSQSTKRKPAWFLTGKDPAALRYIAEETPAVSDKAFVSNASVESHIKRTNPVVSPEIVPVQQSLEPSRNVGITDLERPIGNNVIVPPLIADRKLADYQPSRLSKISEQMGIVHFLDWTEERLKELYRTQPKQLHDVLVQLWFFGVDFQGELGRFIKLERGSENLSRLELMPDIAIEEHLPLDIIRMLERFGIRTTNQLNGIPTTSLEWLFRGRFSDIVQILEKWKRIEDGPCATKTEDKAADEGHMDSPISLHFQGRIVEVPKECEHIEINSIPIYGCTMFISRMIDQCNIVSVRDLPKELSVLADQIKGAGMGTILKFYNQLAAYLEGGYKESGLASLNSEISYEQQYEHQTASEVGKIIWQGQVIELEDGDAELTFERNRYVRTPKLLAELHKRGITRVGDLPALFAKMQEINGVGATVIHKFASQLKQQLEAARLQREIEQEWQEMSHEKRIKHAIDTIEANWQEKLTDEQIRKDRNLQIVYLRWKEKSEGRKPTLEWLGHQFGLTRERVRQIIRKVLQRIHPDVLYLERALKEACEQNNNYYRYAMNIYEKFSHGLMEQVVEEYEGLIYLEQHSWWTVHTQEKFESEADRLRQSFKDWLRGKIVSMDQVQEELPILSQKLPAELAMQIVDPELQKTMEGRYILASSKKYEIVEMVLRQYPKGVEIYKRAKELCESANRIRSGEFVRERDFTSVFQRDEFADTAYLWGRGTFIHHSFVNVDVTLITEVSDKAAELLEKRSPISVGRLFQMFQERLVESNVPNEYALYTMLRKHGSDKLAPNKFPHIWHKEDAFQLSNGELIKAFLREKYEPQTLEVLRDEFIRKRGWKKFTLEFSISNDSDFVSVDLGIVGLREFYPFNENDFEPILGQLQSLLADTGILHVNRLFDSTREQCERMGIQSSYLLYDLLQGLHTGQFRFARYPLITTEGHPLEEVSLQTVVEQYLEEQEAEVPRELVYHWVTEELGARETTLDNVLTVSKDIYYYRGGQFGEYIHRRRLGWTKEKERDLVAYVQGQLAHAEEWGRDYLTLETVWNPSQFPSLNNELEWTEDLFIDCLRKSARFTLFGSMDCIIVHPDNPRIKDETDFIAYILKHDFKGKALLKDIQNKLAMIRYSKDGKFLFETATKLESGEAPFVLELDYVVLK